METTRTELKVATARVTKTPSDGMGAFEFSIDAFDTIDADGEIVVNYVNVRSTDVTAVPVDYGHLAILGAGADPLAQEIGLAEVTRKGNKLVGSVKLDLSNRVAMMVYERLQLPSDDPAYLGEVSVWFAFDPAKATVGGDGVKTIHDAELLSVAVVREGAQATSIENVKLRWKMRKGPGAATFAAQKAALIAEFGDAAREMFADAELSPDAKSLLVKIERDAAARRAALDTGGPRPYIELTSRMAEVQPPTSTTHDEPEHFQLPVFAIKSETFRIEK